MCRSVEEKSLQSFVRISGDHPLAHNLARGEAASDAVSGRVSCGARNITPLSTGWYLVLPPSAHVIRDIIVWAIYDALPLNRFGVCGRIGLEIEVAIYDGAVTSFLRQQYSDSCDPRRGRCCFSKIHTALSRSLGGLLLYELSGRGKKLWFPPA